MLGTFFNFFIYGIFDFLVFSYRGNWVNPVYSRLLNCLRLRRLHLECESGIILRGGVHIVQQGLILMFLFLRLRFIFDFNSFQIKQALWGFDGIKWVRMCLWVLFMPLSKFMRFFFGYFELIFDVKVSLNGLPIREKEFAFNVDSLPFVNILLW